MLDNYHAKITAQVAVEAMIADPSAYSVMDMRTVRDFATVTGVDRFYLDDFEVIIDTRSDQ